MLTYQLSATATSLSLEELHALVAKWETEIGVKVSRIQVRGMKTKWGSVSTAGILTLSSDLLQLPIELAEYVVVHELVHLRLPNHSKAWKVSMGLYLPDWRRRHHRLLQVMPK